MYMDQQEIMEAAAKHLLAQGERSTLFGTCQYRDREGRMCAVGVLIPDERYHEDMEGCPIKEGCRATDSNLHRLLAELYGEHSFPLLAALQSVHDLNRPADWAERLGQVARRFGLQVTW